MSNKKTVPVANKKIRVKALINRVCHFNETEYNFKEGQEYTIDNREHYEKLSNKDASTTGPVVIKIEG